MKDAECVRFLQWALPRLRMRWAGFRRVRRQVCKRVERRRRELGLADVDAYRVHLETHPGEWAHLDALCTISISRFRRDGAVFDALAQHVLPELALRARHEGEPALAAWSVGSASGEEPYSLKMLWELEVQPRIPQLPIRILASELDENLVRRARVGVYAPSSLSEVPQAWREQAFEAAAGGWRVRSRFRAGVRFRRQDVRCHLPDGPFRLVLCRNGVFTYFEPALQRELLRRITARLAPGGALVVGVHESLPAEAQGLVQDSACSSIWRRVSRRKGL